MVFLTALLVRIIYSLAAPAIYFNVDTEGYYTLGTAFFSHPSLQTFVTPYRTPLSGIFLNAVMSLVGVGGAPYGSPAFVRGAQYVVITQMFIGALALTAFWRALRHFLPQKARVLFGVFLLLNVLVIGWEHTLMTEGLAISISLFMTAVLLRMLDKPSGKKFALFWGLFAFGFLSRPSFMIYPIATIPFVAWYYRKQARIVFLTCVTLAAATIVPLAYARINYNTVNYFGVLFEGDIVVLGRILEFNIPVESAKDNTYFYTMVQNARAAGVTATGFQLLGWSDPAIWDKPYRFVQLQKFNRTVILHNLPLYITRAAATVPEMLLEVCDFIRVPRTNILWALQMLYGYAQYATLAIPLIWVPVFIVFLVNPTRWNAVVAITGTIAMSQIVLTALVVYKDIAGQYGRVLSIVQPHMYLFLFLCALTCLRIYRKHQI